MSSPIGPRANGRPAPVAEDGRPTAQPGERGPRANGLTAPLDPILLWHTPDLRPGGARESLATAGLSACAFDPAAPLPDNGPSIVIATRRALGADAAAKLARWQEGGARTILVENVPDAPPLDTRLLFGQLDAPPGRRALASLIRAASERIAADAALAATRRALARHQAERHDLLAIGVALAAEKDLDRLQARILRTARELTGADAGSLYLVEEGPGGQRRLHFRLSQNDSLDAPYAPGTIPLDGQSVAGHAATTARPVRLDDAYALPPDADFRFNRTFDQRFGYRSKSFLAMPLLDHEGAVVGVLQLINRKRAFAAKLDGRAAVEREVIPFDDACEAVLAAFAGQAAVALNNQLLLAGIQRLFDGFVRAAVTAIELREPATQGHADRVATLTVGLAEAVNRARHGPYADFHLDEEQLRELRYASLLHDFGKIGVREQVLAKAKKLPDPLLETVKNRFALAKRTAEVRHWQRRWQVAREARGRVILLTTGEMDAMLADELAELDEAYQLLLELNEPDSLTEEKLAKLAALASRTYINMEGRELPLLDERELRVLAIPHGSLNPTERLEIENHVDHTVRFLSQIPWTRGLRNVPAIAAAHHEKLNGKGYPHGLKGAQVPVQARMMMIADIYDALAASDRPYKQAAPLERVLAILRDEARAGAVDGALLDIFIAERVHELTGPGAAARREPASARTSA